LDDSTLINNAAIQNQSQHVSTLIAQTSLSVMATPWHT